MLLPMSAGIQRDHEQTPPSEQMFKQLKMRCRNGQFASTHPPGVVPSDAQVTQRQVFAGAQAHNLKEAGMGIARVQGCRLRQDGV